MWHRGVEWFRIFSFQENLTIKMCRVANSKTSKKLATKPTMLTKPCVTGYCRVLSGATLWGLKANVHVGYNMGLTNVNTTRGNYFQKIIILFWTRLHPYSSPRSCWAEPNFLLSFIRLFILLLGGQCHMPRGLMVRHLCDTWREICHVTSIVTTLQYKNVNWNHFWKGWLMWVHWIEMSVIL